MSTGAGGILEVARAEDFVEYFLFPNVQSTELKDINEQLNNNLKSINIIVEKYCKNYIWHKDEFRLTVRGCDENIVGNSIKLLNVDLKAEDDEQNGNYYFIHLILNISNIVYCIKNYLFPPHIFKHQSEQLIDLCTQYFKYTS